jgi:DNA modification methylase
MMLTARIMVGDAVSRLRELPDGVVRTCVTSPPYWGLRDYNNDGQLGMEKSPQEFVENLCQVFDEVWRVLTDDGTLWVNLGDTYAEKSLAGIPWRFAFAMQDRGWYLRQDIIWAKPNPMPESVTDRCTKSHEYIFLLSKQPRYFFNQGAIREESVDLEGSKKRYESAFHTGQKHLDGGYLPQGKTHTAGYRTFDGKRNKRTIWTVNTASYKGAHFAVYPPALIEPCILAGSAEGDTVLDPFSGSGTTGEVALTHGRNYVGIELNPDYAALSEKRITNAIGMLGEVRVD